MEIEELIKKHIQEDLKNTKTDTDFVNQVMHKINGLEKKKPAPLISKNGWIGVLSIFAFTIVMLALIELNFVITLDLPGLTKQLGLFLSGLQLPLIGIAVAIVLIVFDRLFGKKRTTS